MPDGIFEIVYPMVEVRPVTVLPPVAAFLRMLAVAGPTWFVMLLLRPPAFEKDGGIVCEAKTDPADLGTDPNVVEFGNATGESIERDVASKGTRTLCQYTVGADNGRSIYEMVSQLRDMLPLKF